MTAILQRSELAVTLTLTSPFLFPGLAAGAAGVDVACLRDELGNVLLPADQLRGVLKAALVELAQASNDAVVSDTDIAAWFGMKSKSYQPNRGTLVFEDLSAGPLTSRETVRIEIDDEMGAVKTGSLQVIELAAPFRLKVAFTGQIVAWHGVGQQARLLEALNKALKITAAIGAIKSPGFGQIVHAASSITAKSTVPGAVAVVAGAASPRRKAYAVTFDRPILVDSWAEADNVFVGAAIMPGAVIRGALARRLKMAGEDPESGTFAASLAQWNVGPCLPQNGQGQTGLALPLSLVGQKFMDGIKIRDALHVPPGHGVMLAGDVESGGKAGTKQLVAKFQTDWKGWEGDARRATRLPGHGDPCYLPRTHTAVERDVARTGQIFTAVARSHLGEDPARGARQWQVVVDYGAIANAAHAELFDRLLTGEGLDFVGKTSAHATFAAMAGAPVAQVARMHGTEFFAVVLQTAAVMFDAASLHGQARSPAEIYGAYWQVQGGKLENFFASQRLAGGYLAARYSAYGAQYYPFALTEPGSVFLLSGAGLKERLEGWFHTGLPLPSIGGKVPDWRTCPFVPQNGYGRFTADYLSEPALLDALREGVSHV